MELRVWTIASRPNSTHSRCGHQTGMIGNRTCLRFVFSVPAMTAIIGKPDSEITLGRSMPNSASESRVSIAVVQLTGLAINARPTAVLRAD